MLLGEKERTKHRVIESYQISHFCQVCSNVNSQDMDRRSSLKSLKKGEGRGC